jgi:hypothetical protein
MTKTVNESGGGYDHAASVANEAGERRFLAELQKSNDLFLTEWTIEVFTQRRADWNNAVMASKSSADQRALEQKLGYKAADLVRAKKLHNIA